MPTFSYNKNLSANILPVLQNFKLILFIMSYTASEMIRHLTRPYFLESCGSKVLPCLCYTTKKASQFRIKVANIILAETNAESFNNFIVHAISLKNML